MKTFFLTLLAIVQCSISFAQEDIKAEGITISVKIDNVKNNTGTVYFALHNEESFLVSKAIKNAKSTIEDKKVTITFTNIPTGEYAIIAFHDENDNMTMDFEANGMPKEDYATSGNAMSFGPPNFKESKFTVEAEDKSLHMRF